LFFRWINGIFPLRAGTMERQLWLGDDELISGVLEDGSVAIVFSPGVPLPIPIVAGKPKIGIGGDVESFGAKRIAAGLWALSPSLNIPEVIHGFIVLHGVPDPAPWERSIILPGGAL
jgi:hypothetical protein